MIKSENVDWKPYHDFEQSRPKQGAKVVEGRELVIDLPNEWYTSIYRNVGHTTITYAELERRVKQIVEVAVGKTTDLQYAVHWNKARTNFHVHVIFSERTREDKGTWDRDVYLTAEGKVARRAAERRRDADGNVRPPVHRKGDAKGDFSAKNDDYSKKWWLAAAKTRVENTLKEYGVTIDERGFVSQYHEGKGSDAPKIRQKNDAIKITNANYKAFVESCHGISKRNARKAHREAVAAAKEGKVADFSKSFFSVKVKTYSLDEWEKKRQREEERAARRTEKAQKAPKAVEVDKSPDVCIGIEVKREERAAEPQREAAADQRGLTMERYEEKIRQLRPQIDEQIKKAEGRQRGQSHSHRDSGRGDR